MRFLSTLLCWLLLAAQAAAAQTDYAQHIASLIDPAKLATLRERGANSRVQKAVYWLETGRKEGEKPSKVLDLAVALAGYKRDAAKMTRDALLRNLDIAEKLGCLNAEGLGVVYFADAEDDPDPTIFFPANWAEVKEFFKFRVEKLRLVWGFTRTALFDDGS